MSHRDAVVPLVTSSLRGRGREVRGLVAWSAVEALPAFLSGRLVAQALDDGFLAGRVTTGLTWLATLAVTVAVGAWGTRQMLQRLAGLVEPFRDELVVRTVTGALRRSTTPGGAPDTGAVARLTQHVEIAREAYGSVLVVVQGFVVSGVGALLGLLTIVPAALALVVPPLLLGLALFLRSLRRLVTGQRAAILADERLAEAAETLAGGLRDTVACGGEEVVAGTVGARIEERAAATRALARLTAIRTFTVAIAGWLPIVLVLAAGPWLLRRGATTGEVVGTLTYLLHGLYPALQTLVRQVSGSGLWLVVALRRILEASEAAAEAGKDGRRAALTAPPNGYAVRLRSVTFRYGSSSDPVVSGLDLDVPQGDHLAVVGPSGVGKSTLAGLIAGVLEPETGTVLLGDVRVGDVETSALAPHRVLIPQQAYVFDGTLWENLSYLNPEVSRVEVDEAVDLLGIRPLVERLGGHDARLQPSSLSAGERQLITLARAYVSPAPVILLDEATCHLDPPSEARVERAFARRRGTLVVIAHRISSARRSRRILVLDGTTAPACGTHDELVRSSPLYRDLVGHWSWTPRPTVEVARRAASHPLHPPGRDVREALNPGRRRRLCRPTRTGRPLRDTGSGPVHQPPPKEQPEVAPPVERRDAPPGRRRAASVPGRRPAWLGAVLALVVLAWCRRRDRARLARGAARPGTWRRRRSRPST